jgi:formylglycine-generating enzyme required for sulfatase activity
MQKGNRPVNQGAAAPVSSKLVFAIMWVSSLIIGVLFGCAAWFLFGSHTRIPADERAKLVQVTGSPQPSPEASLSLPTPEPTPVAPSPSPAETIQGLVTVEGGEVLLGGEGTGMPVRREQVETFDIAETEVTNEQYREFVLASGHRPPRAWTGQEFASGAALEPVTGVSWFDAVAYCEWLSQKTGLKVELPTEAEWERAARGRENYKYPWGNEWDERAAVAESKVSPVKSFPANKSPFGAYDMAGSVWEWVADQASDELGRPKSQDGVAFRVIKGGSAEEERLLISNSSRHERLANKPRHPLGFRYVVRRKKEASSTSGARSDPQVNV